MAVYNQLEVDIPKEGISFKRRRNGLTTLVQYTIEAPYNREKGYPEPKRIVIGHLCEGSKTRMHPTTNYWKRYPGQWEKITGKTVNPARLKIGLYAAFEAISSVTGLDKMLNSVFGLQGAQALIDYALFSVLHHSNSTTNFQDGMKDEMLFSRKSKNETFYSDFFDQGFSEDQEQEFKRAWARYCKKAGVEKVWLSIDGSNLDCNSQGVEFAEPGKAKSGKNHPIIAFTYAVTTSGMPVTFEVYRGSLVDAKALKEIIDFLKSCGIEVEGVILDRGYCTVDSIKLLDEYGIKYIIMCKANSSGFKRMLEEFGDEIRVNMNHWVWGTRRFAIQEKTRIFQKFDHLDYLTLYFDLPNATDRIVTFLDLLNKGIARIEKEIEAGEKAEVDEKYEKWLSVNKREGRQILSLKASAAQELVDKKGFSGIISSEKMTPRAIDTLYHSRSASEVQFRVLKTELGNEAIRVHITSRVKAKFTAAFLSSIVRWEIGQAAREEELGLNTNHMIAELDKIYANLLNDVYVSPRQESDRIKKFFSYFGQDSEELIEDIVRIENDRIAGRTSSPRKRKPGPKKGSHHKKYDEQGNEIPRKRGLKKGTKLSDVNKDGTPRKKPGVAPGTKRGKYNKDGSLRKKPGPKPKMLQPAA